ncbi:ATPase domain-containing protein [Marinibacterium profundimaris]|uniref:ATPase domain-containing protein n=1 Tax=Marinibacterium profundimaris TaxID=1679460 RepID=UPI000B520096|nr:ATPase domain-containing protein [Marinibacterium profundimaris]
MMGDGSSPPTANPLGTGVEGFDDILNGGLPAGHVYMVSGAPGTGKTTLGLQFLLAGRAAGSSRGMLYLTLSQTAEELRGVARSHGFDLSGINIVDLLADEIRDIGNAQSVLHSSEEELAGLITAIETAVATHDPERIVIDGLSEIRLVSSSLLRFRRSLLGLKVRLSERETTVMMIDGFDDEDMTKTAELIAHGAIRMDWQAPDYGVAHRRVQVIKMRGAAFVEGFHDMRIATGGLEVSPRLVPPSQPVDIDDWELRSGVEALDDLCGGGLPGNGTTLISGSTGAGKSILCTIYARQTALRGHRASVFLFEEMQEDFVKRSRSLNMGLDEPEIAERCKLVHIDPAELSPGEVFDRIVHEVEAGTRLVILDSLTGFFHALPEGRGMLVQFNAILNYLKRQKVAVLMTRNISGTGPEEASTMDLDVSFVADNLIRMRQIQTGGQIERVISVAKKRYGAHSREVRRMRIEAGGVTLEAYAGDPPAMTRGDG